MLVVKVVLGFAPRIRAYRSARCPLVLITPTAFFSVAAPEAPYQTAGLSAKYSDSRAF